VQREAQYECQLAAVYSWDSSETWNALHEKVEATVRELNQEIAKEFPAKGRPLQFAPSAYVMWMGRGVNACKEYRAELRRAFRIRNEREMVQAKLKIQQASLEIRTKLMADSLESAEAKAFLESMPTPERLMPALTIEDVRRMIAPPGENRK
jgi:hypothetical protein